MNNKDNSTIVVVIILTIVLLGSFIIYDKVFRKENKNEEKQCDVTKTDYTNNDILSNIPVVCNIDMSGLNEINIFEKCGNAFYSNRLSYQIRVDNLKYKNTNYTYTYVWEKDTFYPREEDTGIVKMYIGSNLITAHDGAMRYMLWNIKTNGDYLHIKEATETDINAFESDYDLDKIIK